MPSTKPLEITPYYSPEEEKTRQSVTLTDRQMLYIISGLMPEVSSKAEIATFVGVHKRTLYRWDTDQEFLALKHRTLKKLMSDDLRVQEAWEAMHRAATRRGKENAYAGQMFLSRFDKEYKPERAGGGNLTLNQTTININQPVDTKHLEDVSRQLQGLRGVESGKVVEAVAEPVPKPEDNVR